MTVSLPIICYMKFEQVVDNQDQKKRTMEGLLHIIQKILMQKYGCFHTEDEESLGKELVSKFTVV